MRRTRKAQVGEVSIYQDDEILYIAHTGCGPNGGLYPNGPVTACDACGTSGVTPFTGEKLELRVGPRRTEKQVKDWAESWLKQTVEVKIKR